MMNVIITALRNVMPPHAVTAGIGGFLRRLAAGGRSSDDAISLRIQKEPQ